MLLIFFFVYSIYVQNITAKIIVCDEPKNISISKNEFIFVESVNFPMNMTKEIRTKCNFFLSANNINDSENMALIFIANNGELRDVRRGFVKRYDNLTANKLRAYYNHDTNITIHYNALNTDKESKENTFFAYVSIVKQSHSKTNLSCIFKQTPCQKINIYNTENGTKKSKCTKLKWSLPHNYTGYGYPNNAYCEKIIQLKPMQQMYASVTYLHSEKYVDVVKYYNGSDDFVGTRLEQRNVTVFFPYESNETKDVKLRFESDGSVQGNGFSVDLEIFDCKCSDPNIVIPCEGTYNYSIMGSHTFQYCAGLSCNFTITVNPKCPEKYGLLKFNTRIYALSAHFFVISNNETILNSTLAQRTALITPKSETYFYIFTAKVHKLNSIKDKGFVQLIISADRGPERLPSIILTNEKPAYVLEFTQNNSAITVELSNELKAANDVIETLHLPKTSAYPQMKCYTIYYYSNFTHVMGMLHFYRNGITSQLTIYKHYDCTNENVTILFRSKYHHAKNCIFKETTFEIRAKQEQTASMIARNNGYCYFVIVNQVVDNNNLIFTKLWTNSKEEMVEIFSGIHFSAKLLQFSHNTFLPWKTLILNRQFYIAVIPPNSSLMLQFYPYVIPFNITSTMVSIFDTPYHQYPNTSMNQNFIYEICNNDTSIMIDAIDVESTETLKLVNEKGNLSRLTTNIEASSMLQETTVNLYYTQLNWHYKDYNDSFLYFKIYSKHNK